MPAEPPRTKWTFRPKVFRMLSRAEIMHYFAFLFIQLARAILDELTVDPSKT
jgi:hypothetical protein